MLKEFLTKNPFIKNSVVLISGTAASQVIAILFQLILRKIYPPEVFGAFAVYLSTFSIIAVFSSFKYENAIVIPKKEEQGTSLFYLSLLISLVFSFLLLLVFIPFRNEFADLIQLEPEYADWLLILPAAMFMFGIQKSINFLLIRKKAFKYSATDKIVRRGSEGALQTLLGVKLFSGGLVWGHLAGNFFYNVVGFFQIRKLIVSPFKIAPNQIKYVMGRYKNFPKLQAFPFLLNTVSLMLPVIIVNVLYNQEITGFFDLTRQVLALPLALISTSLSQVILQSISEKRNVAAVTPQVFKVFAFLIFLTIPGVFIVLIWGKGLFGIFGQEYEYSGEIAKILVFSYSVKFVVSPLSSLLTALEKLKILAVWRVFFFIAILSLFLIDDVNVFAFFKIYMAIEVIFYLIYAVIIFHASNQHDKMLNYDAS